MAFAPPLTSVVDALYGAFDGDRPVDVPHCDHCVSDEEIAELLAAGPLRQVPSGVLQPYLSNLVVGTAGSPEDARYFLPRILEVSLAPGAWPDLTMVARYLGRTELGLTGRQRALVHDFFRASWWAQVTGDPVLTEPVEETLCAAAHVTGDLTPLLEQWARMLDQPHPRAHLLALVDGAELGGDGWRLRDPWWEGRDRQVDAWLRSDGLRAAVNRVTGDGDQDRDLDDVLLWSYLGGAPHGG